MKDPVAFPDPTGAENQTAATRSLPAQLLRPEGNREWPSVATRTFIEITSLFALLFEFAIRLRIQLTVPLPSSQPLLWHLGGFAEDVLVLALVASLLLALARHPRMQLTASIIYGGFVALLCVASVAQSEAVTFVGAELRPEDLKTGIPTAVISRSLEQKSGMLMAVTVAFLFVAIIAGSALRLVPELGWLTIRRSLGLALCAALTMPLVTRVHRIAMAANPVVALVALGHEEAQSVAATRTTIAQPTIPLVGIRELLPATPKRTFIDDRTPLAYLPAPEELTVASPGVHPNIVFIVVESLRAEEVGVYGADPPGITPNLDELARNGIHVDPFYSVGTFTASVESALWYGLPPIPKEVLLSSRPELALIGLPEILRASGWKTFLWIHDGDVNFYRRDLFYKPRGFRMIDGRQFPVTDPQTNWGYSDRSLARRAVLVLDRAQQPFASLVLTVTNHHPYQLPSDAGPKVPDIESEAKSRTRARFAGLDNLMPQRTAPMIQTVHYSDQAIGDFFRLARTRPWFHNTIFLIMGDHGVTIAPLRRSVTTQRDYEEILHRVPLVIYSPLFEHKGITIHRPASHVDLMPTILGLAGIKKPWTGLGANILDASLDPDRPIVTWSTHGRTLGIITPHRTYYASFPGNQPLADQTPQELLVDPVRDPRGLVNLATRNPPELAHFRHLTSVYLQLYPWIVVDGHSGIPLPALRQ